MDEEQIRALLTEHLGTLKTEILSEVDRKNAGTAASISKEFRKAIEAIPQLEPPATEPAPKATDNPADDKGRLTTKALQSELEKFKREVADRDAAIAKQNREAALRSTLANKGVIAQNVLFNALNAQHGGKLQQDGDQWFVVDGDSVKALTNVIDDFLATDDGKAFLPPSGVNGGGSSESKPTSVPADEMTAGAALMAAFSE